MVESSVGLLFEEVGSVLVGALKAMDMKLTRSSTVDLMIVYHLPHGKFRIMLEGNSGVRIVLLNMSNMVKD